MKAQIQLNQKTLTIDFNKPIDLSLPLQANDQNPIAWYYDAPKIEPVVFDGIIGSVSNNFSTNFYNISFNPHAHGTHTECLGHITKVHYSIQDSLKTYFFYSKLITVDPIKIEDDFIITRNQISALVSTEDELEALIIRTLPNTSSKKSKNYSHTNPPYLSHEAASYIKDLGIKHLLIDLPSVDKEKDNGLLLAHKAFWNVTDIKEVNQDARFNATITELIFVEDTILDGYYILNLQIAPFVNDATPSKPILYALE